MTRKKQVKSQDSHQKETLLKNLNELQAQDTHQQLEHSQYATKLHTIIKQALTAKTALQVESMTKPEIESLLPQIF